MVLYACISDCVLLFPVWLWNDCLVSWSLSIFFVQQTKSHNSGKYSFATNMVCFEKEKNSCYSKFEWLIFHILYTTPLGFQKSNKLGFFAIYCHDSATLVAVLWIYSVCLLCPVPLLSEAGFRVRSSWGWSPPRTPCPACPAPSTPLRSRPPQWPPTRAWRPSREAWPTEGSTFGW